MTHHDAVVAGHTFVRARNDPTGRPLANRDAPQSEARAKEDMMKYLMIISSMMLGLAMPALAQDQEPAPNAAKQQEGVLPPTNRLDKLVPTMKAPGTESGTESDQGAATDDSASSGAASGISRD